MLTEVKLYLLTKHLMGLYSQDVEKVKQELKHLLNHRRVHPDYWEYWMVRFSELDASRDIQIIMMRESGMTYRKIQDTLGISPNTIQHVLSSYDLSYGELDGTEELKDGLTLLHHRLREAGSALW